MGLEESNPLRSGYPPLSELVASAAHRRIIGPAVKSSVARIQAGITKSFFSRSQSWPAEGVARSFLRVRPRTAAAAARRDSKCARGFAALMQCCSLHGRPRTVLPGGAVELSGLRRRSASKVRLTHTPVEARRAFDDPRDFCLLAPPPSPATRGKALPLEVSGARYRLGLFLGNILWQ